MIKFTVIAVGKIKERYMQDAISDYVTRLTKYSKIEIIEVPESFSIQKEGEALIKRVSPGSFCIALDLGGRQMKSEALASFIGKMTVSGVSHFTFFIGGSDGLDQSVLDICDHKLCLSEMTFPHQLARLLLVEQLYRSMKINAGETYHK